MPLNTIDSPRRNFSGDNVFSTNFGYGETNVCLMLGAALEG
jgi:hypothetical protein